MPVFQTLPGWAGCHRIGAGCRAARPSQQPRTAQRVSQIVPAADSLNLTEGAHAPARARAWVNAHTAELPRDTVEDALLMVSELVTNAVRHGSPDVVLTLDVLADRIRIAVHDAGDSLPLVAEGRPAVERPTGRGLLIVAATASDWGVTQAEGRPGKTVWAELPFG